MIDNRAVMRGLLRAGRLRMEAAPFLDAEPAPPPGGGMIDFDRVEGMLLGLAIGDSLGNTSEGMFPAQRQREGDIRDFQPNPHANWRQVGTPSDDTQLAFWTLEQLLEDDGLVPERLAERFCRDRIFGIGSTVSAFLRDFNQRGVSWSEAGQESAGNGALMRIAPVLVPHLRQPSPALWADAALAGMVTHNDRASNAAYVAFVHLLWRCLSLERPPEPAWWLDNFVPVMEALEGEASFAPRQRRIARRRDQARPRGHGVGCGGARPGRRQGTNGLAWELPLDRLWEGYVEGVIRREAAVTGGEVRVGRQNETLVPLHWTDPVHRSLGHLLPDIVVHHRAGADGGPAIQVVDAKYKAHLAELDEVGWREFIDEQREAHRADIHQVLAYAGAFEANEVRATLVYPLRRSTWEHLHARGHDVSSADLYSGGRHVRLELRGIPFGGSTAS